MIRFFFFEIITLIVVGNNREQSFYCLEPNVSKDSSIYFIIFNNYYVTPGDGQVNEKIRSYRLSEMNNS